MNDWALPTSDSSKETSGEVKVMDEGFEFTISESIIMGHQTKPNQTDKVT